MRFNSLIGAAFGLVLVILPSWVAPAQPVPKLSAEEV